MASDKTEIYTCYIHNGLAVTSRHYGELMCHACYHLIQRIRAKYTKETGQAMDIDEAIKKAITRRMELKESGKWEKDAKRIPNIRIGILK